MTEKRNDIKGLYNNRGAGDPGPPETPPDGPSRAVIAESRAIVLPRAPGGGALAPSSGLAERFASARLDLADSFIAQFSSAASQRTMRQGLERCARILETPFDGFPWQDLRFEHTAYLRGRLLEPGAYERATAAITLAALRGVLKHAWRLGRIPSDDYQRAVDWPQLPRRETPLRGRELTQGELDALRAHWEANDGAYGRFLGATFALLMGAGLRASEVCRMPVEAYDPAGGTVHVLRKGGKKVVMPLGHEEIRAVDTWLLTRKGFERRIKSPALLYRVQANDWVRPGSAELNVKALEYLCATLAERLHIPYFTPHDLRRTFATRMGRAGMDLRATQWFMSHESPTTTARYDRREAEEYARSRRRVNLWAPPPLNQEAAPDVEGKKEKAP